MGCSSPKLNCLITQSEFAVLKASLLSAAKLQSWRSSFNRPPQQTLQGITP